MDRADRAAPAEADAAHRHRRLIAGKILATLAAPTTWAARITASRPASAPTLFMDHQVSVELLMKQIDMAMPSRSR